MHEAFERVRRLGDAPRIDVPLRLHDRSGQVPRDRSGDLTVRDVPLEQAVSEAR